MAERSIRRGLPPGARAVIDASVRFRLHDPFLGAARTAGALRWGVTISGAVHAWALRSPRATAIVDDAGRMTYRELDRAADALAIGLRGTDGPVGLLCRNHRGFSVGQLAIERAGRAIVLLNTVLPAAQLVEIVQREGITTVVGDEEYALLGAGVEFVSAEPDALPKWRFPGLVVPRWVRPETVLLTSGTTGPPKGARQEAARPNAAALGMLEAIPVGLNEIMLVTSPLFHAWGFAQSAIALATGGTLLLHRRFDATQALGTMRDEGATALVVVPTILKRLLDAAPDDLALPELRLTMCSGNVLSGDLARQWIDRFGPNLYNIYGSTETSIATVALPADLVEAPGTVGRPPRGVTITILDDDDRPVAEGEAGRVFTANGMQFAGYTDGSDKTRLDELMATGDFGWLDDEGRLFIDGRENDMIVSGGENVFPAQIEEVLMRHPEVGDVTVAGIPDDEFGQIVGAWVVAAAGSDLDLDELRRWADGELASFQRPRRYAELDELPRTGTGKVRRNQLAAEA